MCKCPQRVTTKSNLNRIQQSKYLRGSRESKLSARKTPGSIQASITERQVLERSLDFSCVSEVQISFKSGIFPLPAHAACDITPSAFCHGFCESVRKNLNDFELARVKWRDKDYSRFGFGIQLAFLAFNSRQQSLY